MLSSENQMGRNKAELSCQTSVWVKDQTRPLCLLLLHNQQNYASTIKVDTQTSTDRCKLTCILGVGCHHWADINSRFAVYRSECTIPCSTKLNPKLLKSSVWQGTGGVRGCSIWAILITIKIKIITTSHSFIFLISRGMSRAYATTFPIIIND